MGTNQTDEVGGGAVRASREFAGVDIGVIGVTTPRTRASAEGPDRSPWLAMEDYAALVCDRTPIRALPLPLSRVDAATVASRIAGLPARVAAVFVIGLGPSESASVQRTVSAAGGRPVISELDVVTAALGAAAITMLRRRGIGPRRGRIVITATESAPQLGPLLRVAGGGTVTSWHDGDAQAHPLRRLMDHNDVLIDLAGTAPETAAPRRTLTLPGEPFDYGGLVLPGLLSALCGHGSAGVSLDVLGACTRALALITPPGRVLPALDERLLVPAVARHVSRAVSNQPHHRPYQPS